jgi:hypothetical protein
MLLTILVLGTFLTLPLGGTLFAQDWGDEEDPVEGVDPEAEDAPESEEEDSSAEADEGEEAEMEPEITVPEPPPGPVHTQILSDKGLLYLKSGAVDLRLRGFFQFALAATEDDSVYGRTTDGFSVWRGRLALSINVEPHISFLCTYAPWGPANTLLDVKTTFRFAKDFPEVRVVAGQYRIPFCNAGLKAAKPFPDHPFIRAPRIVEGGTFRIANREIGLHVEGDLFGDRLYYALGFFSGDGINTWPLNSDLDTMVRILASPFRGMKNPLEGITAGVSYMNGHQPMSWWPDFFHGWRERFCITLQYKWEGLEVEFEFIRQNYSRQWGECQKTWNAYVQAAWAIPLIKKESFALKIQPLFRFEHYEPSVTFQDTEHRVIAGCNVYLGRHAVVGVNLGVYKGNFDDDREDNEILVLLQVRF